VSELAPGSGFPTATTHPLAPLSPPELSSAAVSELRSLLLQAAAAASITPLTTTAATPRPRRIAVS